MSGWRPRRRINNFGWIHGEVTISGDAWHMPIYGVNSSPARGCAILPHGHPLLAAERVDTCPLVTHVAPLDEMDALLRRDAARKKGYIKGVVTLEDA